LDGLRDAQKHLAHWMRPRRRSVDPLLYSRARNRLIPQPLGVVGVIVPWNYPIFLRFVNRTSFHHRCLQRLQSRGSHEIGMWRKRQTSAAVSALSSRAKSTLIVFLSSVQDASCLNGETQAAAKRQR
jgi:hypothetical protein